LLKLSNQSERIKGQIAGCRFGDVEAAEDFIAVGKDVNMQDDEGRTPLHYAAAHNNTRIAQLLVDSKADLEKVDSKNNTALHYACGYGRLDVVDILLRGGASVSAENENGKKPLDLAKLNSENPVLSDKELVEQLGA
jgi:ankyrin repeat protein